jgi:rod shape determining protein RodA
LSPRNDILKNIDWWTVLLYLALVLIGWVNIYAAVFDETHSSIFDVSRNYGKQLLWIGTSVVLAIIILVMDPKVFIAFAFPIYFIVIISLVAVLLFGSEVSGSKSWFQIGGFSIQPAEFAKFATSLAIAKFLSRLNVNLKKPGTLFQAIIILSIPVLLILLQYDTGSAMVYSAFIFVLYREGMTGSILVIGLTTIFLFLLALLVDVPVIITGLTLLAVIFILIIHRTAKNIAVIVFLLLITSGFVFSVDYVFDNVLEKHHQTRINVLLGKETDLHGAGYNVHQSLIAIGSGGFSGKGFLEGTQTKFNFVPEQSTDFIFCTIGEEWGFLGSTALVILFITLLLRLVYLAEKQRSPFSRIYGYSVASILFFHFTVNIAMTLGLFPVIGIPLPFISYGGSSLWAFTILLFVFLKLDSDRLNVL